MKSTYYFFLSLRPHQWLKNILIFAGLIFAQKLFNISLLLKTVFAFLLFSFASGSLYILNDIKDYEKDKLHPEKKKRPIASGLINKKIAFIFAIILLILSLIFSYILSPSFFWVLVFYIVLFIFYTLYLKDIVILDVIVVSIGFLLRAWAGTILINVSLSEWLFICTILLALFLALTKRKTELEMLNEKAIFHRKVLKYYSHNFLDQMISVTTASSLIAYGIYTVAPETINKFKTKSLVLTLPFVIYGIFRYLYLVYQKQFFENPDKAFIKDIPLLINIVLWFICVVFIIYKVV
ncbi:MAG: decaprenyl-phosphate phosphoribosyltransferase [candidate division WOR-3 bacterium]|nr:decaprenyl-phosphate phosphoribosyltransferase [candidate division WOR-3 bacterium]MCX7836569.1 decaprenyl-phosphate phosphoribosyltransferase [candidate division WOR-3 bacterium]MDW8113914.1 decaprenyl-phosphate phosphoribosyltransferase [candidate division WOR-3 bacterium]